MKYNCPNCKSETFVIDRERSGVQTEMPKTPLLLDAMTTVSIRYVTFGKCSECGYKLPKEMVFESPVVIKFYPKEKLTVRIKNKFASFVNRIKKILSL